MALGAGGKTTNQSGALGEIAKQPGGKILLVLMAIGLFGYAFWRLCAPPSATGRRRATTAWSGSRASTAGSRTRGCSSPASTILLGSGGGSEAARTRRPAACWVARRSGHRRRSPGSILIGVGLFQGYEGVKKKFLEKSKTEQMSETTKQGFTTLGIAGHLARMVVFVLIGYFLAKAAIDYDPDKAVSVDGALAAVAKASYGKVLLGIVAAGTSRSGPTRSPTRATAGSDPAGSAAALMRLRALALLDQASLRQHEEQGERRHDEHDRGTEDDQHARERGARRGGGGDRERLRKQVRVLCDPPAADHGGDGSDREGPGSAARAAAQQDEHGASAQRGHDHQRERVAGEAVIEVARVGPQRDDAGDRERARDEAGRQRAGAEVALEIEGVRRGGRR